MYLCRITARGYELDSYGHVNNAVFYNYFEHARWEIFMQKNLLEHLTSKGLFLVVVEVNIRYQHEVKLGDEIEIRTKVRKEEPFIIFDQKMKLASSGLPLARARVKTVFVDDDRISQDIPQEIESVFAA